MVTHDIALWPFLKSAIARFGSPLLQKIIRLRKIDGAISSGRYSSTVIQTAIADFETVKGSYQGKLTQSLATYIQELERSGLITTLAEQALIKADLSTLKETFRSLHDTICGEDSGDFDKLFESLSLAVQVTVEQLSKDKSISFLISAYAKDLRHGVAQISEQLQIVSDHYKSQTVQFKALAEALEKIVKALPTKFKHVRVETNKGSKLIDITKIYIPSKLYFRKPEQTTADGLNITEKLLKGGLTSGHSPDDLFQLSYQDFRNIFKRAVVLGDPGGGKSTLCQYLCFDLAKKSGLGLDFENASQREQQNERIPLRMILRSFEAARVQEPQLSIFDYFLRDIDGSISSDIKVTRQALEYSLHFGRAVIAFDGLDEILDTGKRREFVGLVTEFSERFPLCPVLVTSRAVGYEDAPLPDSFLELGLKPFEKSEIREYVTKFLSVVEGIKKEDAAPKAAKFVTQTDPHAGDLRSNPLMLGLMAFLFSVRGNVPENRPEIYKECAILMFERWDQNRGIKADIPLDFDLLHLFGDIASRIYGNSELEDGVGKDWLYQSVLSYFRIQYESQQKAVQAAKSVSGFVTGRSWVMSEFGVDKFRFSHRTFMEYFYARHLDEHHETIQELLKVLEPHVVANEWEVISHLALQLKTYRNQRRVSQALPELKRLVSIQRRAKAHNASMLKFAAEALGYLPGAEVDLRATANSIMANALRLAKDKATAPTLKTVFHELCFASQERREFIRGLLVRQVSNTLAGEDDDDKLVLAAIIQRPDEFVRYVVPRQIAAGLPSEVSSEIRRIARPALAAKKVTNISAASLCWQFYGDIDAGTLKKFGFNLLCLPSIGIGGAKFDLFSELFIRVHSILHDRVADPSAITAMKAIGQTFADMKAADEKQLRLGESIRIPLDIWEGTLTRAKSDTDMVAGLISYAMFRCDGGGRLPRALMADKRAEIRSRDEFLKSPLLPFVEGLIPKLDEKRRGVMQDWLDGTVVFAKHMPEMQAQMKV